MHNTDVCITLSWALDNWFPPHSRRRNCNHQGDLTQLNCEHEHTFLWNQNIILKEHIWVSYENVSHIDFGISLFIAASMRSLQWRHNERDGVSNYQPRHCLLNRFFKRRSKKTSMLRVTGLCVGNSPVTGEFPAQMASNTENVSILWRHHVIMFRLDRKL